MKQYRWALPGGKVGPWGTLEAAVDGSKPEAVLSLYGSSAVPANCFMPVPTITHTRVDYGDPQAVVVWQIGYQLVPGWGSCPGGTFFSLVPVTLESRETYLGGLSAVDVLPPLGLLVSILLGYIAGRLR